MSMHVFAYARRSYGVVAALKYEGWYLDPEQVGSVVRHECHSRELLRNLRICSAETIRELFCQLGPVRVAHDRRCHGLRPAHVIGVEKLQQLFDLRGGEAADVVPVVDVARRGADQNELLEECRRLGRGENADHGADRVTDEGHTLQFECAADFQNVVGIALQVRVLGGANKPTGPNLPRRHDRTEQFGNPCSKAGATYRHMFWSQPKPCAKSIERLPSPRTWTLLRVRIDI